MKAPSIVMAFALLASASAPAAEPSPPRPAFDPIDVELRRLCDIVERGIRRLPVDASYRRVAVLPFTGVETDLRAQRVRMMITDYLGAYCLPAIHRMVVVQPDASLAASTDPQAQRSLARASGIPVLVTGKVARGTGDYTVSVRVRDVELEEQAMSMVRLLPIGQTDDYTHQKLDPQTPGGAALRSLAAPGWGQFYNGDTVKGALVIGLEVMLISTAVAFAVAEDYEWARDEQKVTETLDARRRALDHRLRMQVAIGAAAAVWVGSIVDAYLSGYRYRPEDAFRSRLHIEPSGIDGRLGGSVSLEGWW